MIALNFGFGPAGPNLANPPAKMTDRASNERNAHRLR